MDLLKYSTRQEDEITLPETVNKNINIRTIADKRRNKRNRIKEVLSITKYCKFSRCINVNNVTMTTDQYVLS